MWHPCASRVNERGICKSNNHHLAEGKPTEGLYSMRFVLLRQDLKNNLVVIPHRKITNTPFWALKDVKWKMLSICLQRWLFQGSLDCRGETQCEQQIPGWLRDVPSSMTSPTACALGCTTKKQPSSLTVAALHPNYFLGWENYPLAVLQAAFLGVYLTCPPCLQWQDTSWAGAVLAFADRRECWQAAGAHQGLERWPGMSKLQPERSGCD